MSERLDVIKTYKLYINGAMPRSESGRSEPIRDRDGGVLGHSCKASRKDLRDAVVAARAGLGKWKGATPYNRAQILYRMAEMLEARRAEFVGLLESGGVPAGDAQREVTTSVDRLVAFAGWADKYSQVLGCQNPVAGPYWNITVPEPTGVIGVIAPAPVGVQSAGALLGCVGLIAPVIVSGNTCVVLSEAFAPVVSVFGEVMATSDLPSGVVNLLTGSLDELVPVLAKHRDVDGIHAMGLNASLTQTCLDGVSDNLKRVKLRPATTDLSDAAACESVWWIEPFVEFKTAWHPTGA
ncbi:MAG: aldehyde dehydrogenase family protein [Phycisphaerales bacterium]|nr:aldehyde dehydrogenase family protein [Phycisphaerales bacterium]